MKVSRSVDVETGDAMASAAGSNAALLRFLALASAIFVLLVLRRPDSLLNPQFWAEDGSVYFSQALVSGPASIFLPYNSCLWVLPRIVALAVTLLSVLRAPFAFNLIALAVGAGCCALFSLPAYRHLVRSDSVSVIACSSPRRTAGGKSGELPLLGGLFQARRAGDPYCGGRRRRSVWPVGRDRRTTRVPVRSGGSQHELVAVESGGQGACDVIRPMPIYLLAFLIGVVAGLRALTPLAAVSWGARLGWLHLAGTPLDILGFAVTPYILSVFAIGELIGDKLPKTPSRKAPVPFAVRVVMGALCGTAVGAPGHVLIGGLVAGALGGAAGTVGGYEFRSRLVRASGGRDLPIALLEDAIAICAAFWIVSRTS
jgi:uncharacterized membrane protein